eukprot:gene38389-51855_t
MLLSTLLLLGAHLFISTQHANPFVPLACIGLAYSIFGSVIWACVPLIVPLAHHGAAYGLMCAFQNAGQAVVPLIVQCRRFWYAYQHEGEVSEGARAHMQLAQGIASGDEAQAMDGAEQLMEYLERFARRIIDR